MMAETPLPKENKTDRSDPGDKPNDSAGRAAMDQPPSARQDSQQGQAAKQGKAARQGWGRWLALAGLLAAMALAYGLGVQDYLSLSALIREHHALTDYVERNFVSALLLYTVIYVVAVALSFPGASLLTIAGGFLFGWIVSGVVAVFSATLGATLVFLIARSSLGEVFRRRADGWLGRMRAGFQENAFSYLLFLRLTPIFPFWLVNVAPALLGVSLVTYATATVIGIIPGTFAFSIVGSGLESLIQAQEHANPGCAEAGSCNIELSALVTPTLLAALFALGLLALVPTLMKKWRGRERSTPRMENR